MQPGLLKPAAARTRFWRNVALGLSALALGVTGYRVWEQRRTVTAPTVGGEHHARAAREAEPEPREAVFHRRITEVETKAAPAVALAVLSQNLNNAPDSELSEAADALLKHGGPEAQAVLRAAAHSNRATLRDAALNALVSLDTPETRDFMVKELNEPGSTSVINYFLDCREPRALPALERLARSPVQELSRAALDALLSQGASAELVLTRLLQGDPELMDALLATPPHTAGPLHALRAASVARVRAGALPVGPVFDFLEHDMSAESRDALLFAARDPASTDTACSALARRADAASLAGLSQLTTDSDPQVAARASCALASDPDSRSRAPLERALRGKEPTLAARALTHINAPGARAI